MCKLSFLLPEKVGRAENALSLVLKAEAIPGATALNSRLLPGQNTQGSLTQT